VAVRQRVVTGVVGVTVLGVSAFGMGSAHASGSQPSAAVRAACTQVAAVLSDGPDPDADPVGHAEAQILPLRQIKTSDKALKTALGDLSSAYRSFYQANGKGSTKKAVTKAGALVNAICPGAAS
jgi:hypothetical protein